MAVTSYHELPEGQTKSEKAGTSSTPPEHRYGRKALAKTDLYLETEDNILNLIGVALGDYHPSYPFARCIGRKADRVPENKYAWYATYEYTSNWSEIETSDDATIFREKVSWGTRFVQLPLLTDIVTGDAVLNTAKDGFDPPIMYEVALDTIGVEKNYATFPTHLRTLRGTKNDADITIRGQSIPQGEALLKSYNITDELFHNALPYFKVNLEIVLDPLFSHNVDVLNDGLNELFAGDDTDKRKILIKGEPTERPLPLAADGSKIDAADLPANALILSWNSHLEASWAAIGLPI